VTSAGSITFGYDDNGNRITKTDGSDTTTYTYNGDNRLAAVDLPGGSTDEMSFVYDADGNRVSRTNGNYTTLYINGLVEIDQTSGTTTETRSTYTFAGFSVAVRTETEGHVAYLFQDHLGSTVAAWDDTADTRTLTRYYPYGAERTGSGTLPIDQRYTGQTSDATAASSAGSGLLYYNARYYDPQVGMFAAADAVIPVPSIPAAYNRYLYVAGNPVLLSDPSGHCWDPTISSSCDPANARVASVVSPDWMAWINDAIDASTITSVGPGQPADIDPSQFDGGVPACGGGVFGGVREGGGGTALFGMSWSGNCAGLGYTVGIILTPNGSVELAPYPEITPITGKGSGSDKKRVRTERIIEASTEPGINDPNRQVPTQPALQELLTDLTEGFNQREGPRGEKYWVRWDGARISEHLSTKGWGPTIDVHYKYGLEFSVHIAKG